MIEIQKTDANQELRKELSALRQIYQSDNKNILCLAVIEQGNQVVVASTLRKSINPVARFKIAIALINYGVSLIKG